MPFTLSPVAIDYNNEIQLFTLSLVDEQSLQLQAHVTTLNATPHTTPIDNPTLDAALTRGLPIYDPQTQTAGLLIKHENCLYKVPFQKLPADAWGPLVFRNAKQLSVSTTFWNPVNLTLDKTLYAQQQPALLSDEQRAAVMQHYRAFVANPETDVSHKMTAQALRTHLEELFKQVVEQRQKAVEHKKNSFAPMDEFHYKMVCEIILDPWLALQHEAPSTQDYALALSHIVRDTDIYDPASLEALAAPIENLSNAIAVTAINRFGALFYDHRRIIDIYAHIRIVLQKEIKHCGLPVPKFTVEPFMAQRLAIKVHPKNTLTLVCVEAKLDRDMEPKISILYDVLSRHYNNILNHRTRAAPMHSTTDIFIPLINLTPEVYQPLATLASSLIESPQAVQTLAIKKALNKMRRLESKPLITAREWDIVINIFSVLPFCKIIEQATLAQTPITFPELFFQGKFFAMTFDQLSDAAKLRFAETFIPLIALNQEKITHFSLIVSRLLTMPLTTNVMTIIEPYIATITLTEAKKLVKLLAINHLTESRAIVSMLLKPLALLSQSVHSYADFQPFLSYMSHLSSTELNEFLTSFPALTQLLATREDFQALLTDPLFLASLSWQTSNNSNFAGQLIFALAKSRLHEFVKTPADFQQLLNYLIRNTDIKSLLKELAQDMNALFPDLQSMLETFYYDERKFFFTTLKVNPVFKAHFLSKINHFDDIIAVVHSGFKHQVALIHMINSKFATTVTTAGELASLLSQLHYKNARMDVLTTLAQQLPVLITSNTDVKAVLAILPTDDNTLKNTFLTSIESVLPSVTETPEDFATFYHDRGAVITHEQLRVIYSHNLLAASAQNNDNLHDNDGEEDDYDFPYDTIKTTLTKALHNIARANSGSGFFATTYKTPIMALTADFARTINSVEKGSLAFQKDLLVFYLAIKAEVTYPLQATDALYRCIHESMKCLETLHKNEALAVANAPAAMDVDVAAETNTWQEPEVIEPSVKRARLSY